MDDEKITLDSKSFEALAVDSRIKIIKMLKVRRKTLTELAEELGLSISAVREHLGILEKAQLITKIDDGHKWKYYSLTPKGDSLLSPKETKVWFLLSISAIALLLSTFALIPGIYSSFLKTDVNPAALNNYNSKMAGSDSQNTYGTEGIGSYNETAFAPMLSVSNDSEIAPVPADVNQLVVKDEEGSRVTTNTLNETPDELFVLVLVALISGLVFLTCSAILIRNKLKNRA